MGRACSQNGEGRSGLKILTSKPKPTGRGGLGVDGRTILVWTLKR